jgi:cytochrome c biogenesis protein CcmG/thiol:disulfide interchange protein DsbE
MADRETSQAPAARKKVSVSTLLFAAVGVGVLALLAFALTSSDRERPRPGEPAPDFSLPLFDGTQLSLSDLRGQVVVLNFWASWCAPCRKEAPDLQTVWEMYRGQGIVFLGITYQDARNASQEFVEEEGITYPNGIDEKGRISRQYGVTAVPETFIIDRQGRVAWVHIGEVQAGELLRQLEQLP